LADFKNYTNIVSLWNELGIRTRTPVTREANYFKIEFQPTTFTKCAIQYATGKWKTLDNAPLKMIKHNSIPEYMDYVKKAEVQGLEIYGDISPIYQFMAESIPKLCGLDFNDLRTVFMDIEVDSRGGFASPENPYKPITAITVEVWGQYLVWGTGNYVPTDTNILYTKCDSEIELITSFAKWWTSDYPDIISGWHTNGFDLPYIINRIDRLYVDGELKFNSKVLSPWKKINTRTSVVNGQISIVADIAGIAGLDYLELYRKFSSVQQESYKLDYIAEVELGENKISYDEYGSLQDLADKDYQKFIEYNVKDTELVKKLNNKLQHLNLCVQIAYSDRVNFNDTLKQIRLWDAIIYYDLFEKNISIPAKRNNVKSLDYAGAYVKDPLVGKHSWVVSFDVNSLYPSIMREWNISSDRHLSIGFLKDRLAHLETLGSYAVPTNFTPINWIKTIDSNDVSTAIWALRELIDSLNGLSVDKILEDLNLENPYPWLKVLNVCISSNLQVYRSDAQGFLPAILARMYEDRKTAKAKEISTKKKAQKTTGPEKQKLEYEATKWGLEQNTKKLALNSCYGATGSAYFRWFDIRHAESITLNGQMIIRYVANKINEFLSKDLGVKRDYIIASDTDSVILTIENLVSNMACSTNDIVNFVDNYCEKKLQPIINKAFEDIHNKLNTQESILAMKREAIAEHGVWTAKKRYILWIHDNEGVRYNPPRLKITGIEAIRASTPKYARKIIKEALEHFVKADKDSFYGLLEKAEQEFNTRPFNDIGSPRSVNGLLDYPMLDNGIFSKQTPIHVKGALIYNKLLKDSGLNSKYETILNGQKIKFCYLKEQNPFRVNVIASPNKLPPELNIEKYLDRVTQFDKTIIQPLEGIIKYAGWTARPTATLF